MGNCRFCGLHYNRATWTPQQGEGEEGSLPLVWGEVCLVLEEVVAFAWRLSTALVSTVRVLWIWVRSEFGVASVEARALPELRSG